MPPLVYRLYAVSLSLPFMASRINDRRVIDTILLYLHDLGSSLLPFGRLRLRAPVPLILAALAPRATLQALKAQATGRPGRARLG